MATDTKEPLELEHRPDDEVATAIQLAHEVEETRYSPWTFSMLRLYLVLACPYLCGCLNGYDGSLMGGLNGMTSYQHYFHMYAIPPLVIMVNWIRAKCIEGLLLVLALGLYLLCTTLAL